MDLDGTLVLTDTLWESFIALFRVNPLRAATALIWLFHGLATFKHQLAELVRLNVEALPYHAEVLALLEEEASQGRPLVLVTGADASIANAVAAHLRCFVDVISSDGTINMTGRRKLKAIKARLGDKFCYIGNSRSDVAVWAESSGAILVNAPRTCARSLARRRVPILRTVARRDSRSAVWIRALRIQQWSKNALVFLPVLLSHRAFESAVALQACLSFAALSLCASAIYLVNDVFDVAADRRHPVKRNRPFAAGAATIPSGLCVAFVLLVGSATVCALLPIQAGLFFLVYAVVALLYSLALKRVLMLDVVLLAGFYVLRVLIGGASTDIPISVWTLAFMMFLSLTVAFTKRVSELHALQTDQTSSGSNGRPYTAQDRQLLISLGSASSYACVLVVALYINGNDVRALYSHPSYLWLVCPALVYWLGRMLTLADRGSMHDDPVLFALKDRASYWIAGFCLLVGLLAI